MLSVVFISLPPKPTKGFALVVGLCMAYERVVDQDASQACI